MARVNVNTLLWHNAGKKSLATAVQEAAVAHVRRLGCSPTHVILPAGGEWPAEVGGLKVLVCKTVDTNHLKVYNGETDG